MTAKRADETTSLLGRPLGAVLDEGAKVVGDAGRAGTPGGGDLLDPARVTERDRIHAGINYDFNDRNQKIRRQALANILTLLPPAFAAGLAARGAVGVSSYLGEQKPPKGRPTAVEFGVPEVKQAGATDPVPAPGDIDMLSAKDAGRFVTGRLASSLGGVPWYPVGMVAAGGGALAGGWALADRIAKRRTAEAKKRELDLARQRFARAVSESPADPAAAKVAAELPDDPREVLKAAWAELTKTAGNPPAEDWTRMAAPSDPAGTDLAGRAAGLYGILALLGGGSVAAAAYNRVRRRGERQAVQKAVDLYRRNDASPLPLYASPVAGPIDPATGLEKGAADTGLVDRLAGWLTSSGHGGLADKLQKGLAWAGDKLTDDRVQSGLVGASLGGLGGLAVRGHAGDALAGAAIGGAGGAAFPGLYRQVREAYRGDGDSAKPERPAGLPSPGDSARLEKRLQELTPPAAAQVAADVTDRASELKRQMADTTAGQVVGGIGDAIDTTAFGKNPLISRAGGLMSDAAAGVRSQAIRQMAGNGPGTPNAINSPVGHLAIPLGQLSFAQGLDAGGQAASAVGSVMQSPAAQSAGLGAGLAGYNLATRVGRQGTAKFDAQLARSAAARGMAGPQVELKDLARRMGTTPDLLPVEKLRASPLTGKINPRLVGGKVQAAIALAPLVRDWLGRARGAFADNADSVRQMKAERDKLLGGK